nr:DUF1402 family protein [Stappia albiluteola]
MPRLALSVAVRPSRTALLARMVSLLLCLLTAAYTSYPAKALAGATVVPEGNRNASQPRIPFSSARRTAANQSSYDAKFDRVVAVLRRDGSLIRSIKRVAAIYDIDPVHMIGAIIGEHTYNYDSLDSAQSYYVKALAYAGISLDFAYGGENVEDFVQRDAFDTCRAQGRDSNRLWTCYERVWERSFRNRHVDGVRYANKNFNETFFQPLFAGQSFGLGQLSPLTVLKMNDRVKRTSGLPTLTARDANEVYRATMDPTISLHYMAAVLRDSIDAYRRVAGVDISNNPGLTATLYNLGDPWGRATRYREARAAGRVTWPQENYYGWLVNSRLSTLRSLL